MRFLRFSSSRPRSQRMHGTRVPHFENTVLNVKQYRNRGKMQTTANVSTFGCHGLLVRRIYSLAEQAKASDVISMARLYHHDNEFPSVYDHATSSNPPLPFRLCYIRMHARRVTVRYVVSSPRPTAPRSNVGNEKTSEPYLPILHVLAGSNSR